MTRLFSLIVLMLIAFSPFHIIYAQGWEWAKSGMGDGNEYGQSVVADAAGNVYVCGTFCSNSFTYGRATLINPGCPFEGELCDVVFLLKCDPNGNVIWLKTALGSGGAVSVANDNLGNILVAGDFYSATIKFGAITLTNDSDSTNDVFIVKYDTAGDLIWAKSAGGTLNDFATAIQSDQSGNAYVSGYFTSSAITFGTNTFINDSTGIGNVFIVKYDANGTVVWAKAAGGKEEDEAVYLATDVQNNVYLNGYFNTPSIIFGHDTLINSGISQNMFVVKYDSAGNVVWASDPCSDSGFYNPASISTDLYGNLYVTGYYVGTTAILRGLTLFNPNVGGGGPYNVFLVRYDTAGNIKWAKTAAGNTYTQGTAVTNDASGYVYMAGTTLSDSVVFGADTIPDNNIFLVKYDSTGNVLWAANAYGNLFNGYPESIATDASGDLYMTGDFDWGVMIFGNITLSASDTNGFSMYLAKYNTANTSVPVITKTSNIVVYPNPATTSLTISTSDNITSLTITNLLGQTVSTHQYNSQQVQVGVADLPPGVYFVKVNNTEVRKFVKE